MKEREARSHVSLEMIYFDRFLMASVKSCDFHMVPVLQRLDVLDLLTWNAPSNTYRKCSVKVVLLKTGFCLNFGFMTYVFTTTELEITVQPTDA